MTSNESYLIAKIIYFFYHSQRQVYHYIGLEWLVETVKVCKVYNSFKFNLVTDEYNMLLYS